MVIFDQAHFIEAVESEVAELYRSSSPVSVPIDGRPGPEAQAVVCVLRRENRYWVRAALHAKAFRRALVYQVDEQSGGHRNPVEALQKAHAFVEAIGFGMEAVNLKYSPAMREVILRQSPVLLPPQEARKLHLDRMTELTELERLVTEGDPEPVAEAESSPEQYAEQKRARDAQAGAAETAARQLAAWKRTAEQEEACRRAIEPFLAAINAPERGAAENAEREQLKNELAAARKRIAQLEETGRHSQRQESTWQNERTQLKKELAALEKQVGDLQKELHRAEKRMITSDKGRMKLETTLAEAEARAVGLAENLRRTEEEAACARREREEILKTRDSSEDSMAQLAAALQEAEEKITALAAENRKITGTATALNRRAEDLERLLGLAREEQAADRLRLEELQKALREAEAAAPVRIEAAGATEWQRIADLEESLQRAREEAEAARAAGREIEQAHARDRGRLSELEEALRTAAAASGGAAAEDSRGLRDALRQAEERAEFLRQEVERLAAAKAIAEQKLAAADLPESQREGSGRKLPNPRERGIGSLIMEKAEPGTPPHVLRRPPPPGAFFHVDWDLASIPCASLHDICEIHQSIGMVQLSLEGYPSQYCSSFIVVLKTGDRKRLFMSFRLVASGRTLVYVPARQPQDQGALTRTMKEAVRFLQVVGMETERVPFDRKKPKLNPDLQAVISLDSPQQAGNF